MTTEELRKSLLAEKKNGYTLWAESIRKPIVKILKKYGIR